MYMSEPVPDEVPSEEDHHRAVEFEKRQEEGHAAANAAFYEEPMTHESVDEILTHQSKVKDAIAFLLQERTMIDDKLAKLGYGAAPAKTPKRGRPPGTKNKSKAPVPPIPPVEVE